MQKKFKSLLLMLLIFVSTEAISKVLSYDYPHTGFAVGVGSSILGKAEISGKHLELVSPSLSPSNHANIQFYLKGGLYESLVPHFTLESTASFTSGIQYQGYIKNSKNFKTYLKLGGGALLEDEVSAIFEAEYGIGYIISQGLSLTIGPYALIPLNSLKVPPLAGLSMSLHYVF